MSPLAIVASVVILGPPWAYLLYLLVYEPIRLWLRGRNERSVLPSPIFTHGQMTRRQVRRAMKRAGYVEIDTPSGKHRIGLN